MTSLRSMRPPPSDLAQAWWPLEDVAPSNSRWYAEHVTSGWWDPGDMHRTRLRHATALVDELLASLPRDAVTTGARVLELGCGPGSGLQELSRRWPCELHAWDRVQDARATARVLAPGAVVHQTAVPPLPLPDASIDVVWAPRCFARGGSGWAELLAEAHRVLRPRGLLAAILAGPGVWAWEGRGDAWNEELTGMLVLGLDRPDEEGGSICFTSRWWLREHWGRGFEVLGMRPAGVAMVHPREGFGLAVWRRGDGDPLPAVRFAAVEPSDVREGRAFRHQLELAADEARAATARRAATLAGAQDRAARLTGPGAVDSHPRVREGLEALAALEAEVQRLRTIAARSPPAQLRAVGERLLAARKTGS
jgi:SAM-dependent methyltransferase